MHARDGMMGRIEAEIRRRKSTIKGAGAAAASFYADIGLEYTSRTSVVALSKWRTHGFDVRALDRLTLWAGSKPEEARELLAERLGLRPEDILTLAGIPGVEHVLRDPEGAGVDMSDAFRGLLERVQGGTP